MREKYADGISLEELEEDCNCNFKCKNCRYIKYYSSENLAEKGYCYKDGGRSLAGYRCTYYLEKSSLNYLPSFYTENEYNSCKNYEYCSNNNILDLVIPVGKYFVCSACGKFFFKYSSIHYYHNGISNKVSRTCGRCNHKFYD